MGIIELQTYLVVLFILLFTLLVFLALKLGLDFGKRAGYRESEANRQQSEAVARDDAIKRSKAIITGQVAEQIAPYLPDFPCLPADARFIGKPIDFIAFPGLTSGHASEVLFIEVKTGNSRLSLAEKAIKDAVLQKRVRWIEYRIESTD